MAKTKTLTSCAVTALLQRKRRLLCFNDGAMLEDMFVRSVYFKFIAIHNEKL